VVRGLARRGGCSNVGVISVLPEPVASLEMDRGVMALVDDDITSAALRAGRAALGDNFEQTKGNIHTAIRRFCKEVPPHALIVDISGIENPQAVLDDLARNRPGASRSGWRRN
jgi:hypothetical protein